MYALAINTDGSMKKYELKDTESQVVDYPLLKILLNRIGVGFFEIVKFRFAQNDYILCVDEEGLLKEMEFNANASLLCGKMIVGNALVLEDRFDEEIYGLDSDQVKAFLS